MYICLLRAAVLRASARDFDPLYSSERNLVSCGGDQWGGEGDEGGSDFAGWIGTLGDICSV
jgi:hypothetical protein